MPVNFVEEEAPASKISFTPEEEELTPEQKRAGIEFSARQGAQVPGRVISLVTNPAVAAASEAGRQQSTEERRQRLFRELPVGGISGGAPPLIEPEARQETLDALAGAVGAGAVALADIPTRISNIGKPPGSPGYTPLMTEKPRPALPKPELSPLEQELAKASPNILARTLPVTAGLTRAAADVGTGFIQPESGLTLPFLAGGGGVARAAAILFGSQQLASLPRQIQDAVGVLNDPNSTTQDRTEAMARPGVSGLLAATMLKHGIEGPRAPTEPVKAMDIEAMKRAKVPGKLLPAPEEAPAAPAPVPPVVRDVAPGAVDPNSIVPAIRKVGGEVIQGKPGETHPDIITRVGIKAEDIDQRGFSDPSGKQFFLDREAAAKGTQVPTERESGRLHSTDLPAIAEASAKQRENITKNIPEEEAPKLTDTQKIVIRRVKEGIPPENLQITVSRIPEVPDGKADFAQVDEVDPSKPAGQKNIFSSNADFMREQGYDIPTTAELKTLPAGKYTLPEAVEALKRQKETIPTPGETKPPKTETIEPKPATITPEPETKPAAAEVKMQAEVSKTAKAEGGRSAKEIKDELVTRLEAAIKDAPGEKDLADAGKSPESITIDIPGDGVFKILNTKQGLQSILDRAKKLDTSSVGDVAVRKTGISNQDRAWIAEQLAKSPAKEPALSEGPGAASPGDVPPSPPPAVGVFSQPAWERPNGMVSPTSPGMLNTLKNFQTFLLGTVRGMAGHTFPRTTLADRESGEALARYAASRGAALRLAKVFSTESLRGTGVDPAKLGEALTEDNLRSVREGLRTQATQLLAEGKPEEAEAAKAKADAVVSLVGNEGSHFPTEDAYQDFLAEDATKQAFRQHIQQWEEVIDPQFKLAMRLDPDVELPSRGLQTGARVNLKAVFPGEQGVNVVGRAGPSLTGTFRRKTPFGIQAKGTGQAYEVNYHELMANTFQRQLEISNKNDADNRLVASGNAKIGPPGQAVEVAGERGVPFPLARQTLILPGQGAIPQSRTLYVRQSLAREYRAAANVDASFALPVITPAMTAFNRAALAGLTDFTVHMSNQMTALFNRPVSGGIITDSLLSAMGRADVPVTLVKALIKSFGDHEKQLSELAEIGALREPHTGRNPLGRILAKTDQTTRLLLDDAHQRLTKAGLVPDTETARREYVNAIGQYNKRMQGPLTRFLRETGFGPFVVAGKTFNALGVKMATLSPGSKATNAFAAAALRANMLAKWVGFAVLLATLNYLLTKDKKGGPLGRPGVPVGNLDTGKTDARGRPLSIPLMDIFGLGRGLRVTGIKGYAQAKYLGLTDGNALDAAARDVINSAVGPAAGPGPRAAFVVATGSPPALNVPRTSPVAAPGQNQFELNIVAALKDANPVARSFFDLHEGKTPAEAAARQFPRFAMRPGMEGDKAENMPKIVNAAQLKTYTDALAKQARSLPLKDRWKFIQYKYAEDQLTPANKARSIIQLERQGVFRFQ